MFLGVMKAMMSRATTAIVEWPEFVGNLCRPEDVDLDTSIHNYRTVRTMAVVGKTWLAVGDAGSASRSYDSFEHVYELPHGLNSGGGTSGIIYAIAGSEDGTWVAGLAGGWASRSDDDGVTWSALTQGLNRGSATANISTVDTNGFGVWINAGDNGYVSRSTDDGLTWTALTKGLNSGNTSAYFKWVSCVKRTETNSVWIAVATSGYCARSTDGGVTWSAMTQGLNSGLSTADFYGGVTNYTNGISVVGADSGWAARTTDYGATWAAATRGLGITPSSTNLRKGCSDQEGYMYFAGHSGHAVVSDDDGATWSNCTPAGLASGSATTNFITCAVDPDTRVVVSGAGGYSGQSEDHGSSWALAERGLHMDMQSVSGVNDMCASVGGGVYLAVCDSGYASHSHNGLNWAYEPVGLGKSLTSKHQYCCDSDVTGYSIVVGCEDGYASRSTDRATTWTELNRGLLAAAGPTTDITCMRQDGHGVWVALFASGYACRSTDNGATWSALTKGLNCGDASVDWRGLTNDGDGATTSTWIATGDGAYAARSTDGGATWSALTRGLNAGYTPGAATHINAVEFGESGAVVAVHTAGYVTRSTDSGATWADLTTELGMYQDPAVDAYTLASDRNGTFFVGMDTGKISYSLDNGLTWKNWYREAKTGAGTGSVCTSIRYMGGEFYFAFDTGDCARTTASIT